MIIRTSLTFCFITDWVMRWHDLTVKWHGDSKYTLWYIPAIRTIKIYYWITSLATLTTFISGGPIIKSPIFGPNALK